MFKSPNENIPKNHFIEIFKCKIFCNETFQVLGASHFWSLEQSPSHGAGQRSGAAGERAKKMTAGSPQEEPSSNEERKELGA